MEIETLTENEVETHEPVTDADTDSKESTADKENSSSVLPSAPDVPYNEIQILL